MEWGCEERQPILKPTPLVLESPGCEERQPILKPTLLILESLSQERLEIEAVSLAASRRSRKQDL